MRTIGLIGGMSWESTLLYYQTINREVGRRRGALHSAPLHLVSLDFEEIASRQRRDDWAGMAAILCHAAQRLEGAGAEAVVIATNTMHRVAPEVQAAVSVPLLHIGDVTARALRQAGVHRVALLGTRFTMEEPFYAERLAAHGVQCVVPGAADRAEVHRIIFEELCKGVFLPAARARLAAMATSLQREGAEAVVLACTELTLVFRPEDVAMPVFDTTELHALAAADFCLGLPAPATLQPA